MKRRHLLTGSAALAAPALAAARAGAAGGKTLHLAFPAPETRLDPVQTNSDGNTNDLLAQIFEAPLAYDYLARPARLLPNTAVALPEVSADGRRFTITLRPGILFADDPAFKGRPRELVAADYVYAIKRFYDPRYNSSDLYLYESLKLPGLSELRRRAIATRRPFDYDTPVEGIRALDRYSFQVLLGEPDPRFIHRLADPVTFGAVAREVVEFYGDAIAEHPVGTGAYKLGFWRRSSRLELVRSPQWRGGSYQGQPADDPEAQAAAAHLRGKALPLADRVVVDVIEESQPMWLAFVDGTLNWLRVPLDLRSLAAPGGRLAPYLAQRGVQLHRHLRPDILMNFFFMEDPVVGGYTPDKVALRRAIALAFDGDALLRDLMGGHGLRAQSTIPPHTSGYDPAYKSEMSEHDPARAQALLDLYGYVDRDGDGWREGPDGKPLVLRMASTANQLDRRRNEIWHRSMSRVGLRMRFEVSSWPELLQKSRAGTLQMWGYQWAGSSPDGGFFLGIAYGPNAGESNDPRFQLPAFDRLFERQRALPDGPEREAVMRRAKDLLVAYMPYKVHAHNVLLDVVQPWTKGYWRHPFMRDVWRFVDPQPSH